MGPRPTCTTIAVLVGTLVLGSSTIEAAQAKASGVHNLLLGTWQLNLAKSRYRPGPPPKSETRRYTASAEGAKGVVERINGDGTKETIEYIANDQGEYPVTGTEAYDAVRFKRLDANTWEAVLAHAGNVYGVARRVITSDGKSMTITFRREGERFVENVAVYEKLDPR